MKKVTTLSLFTLSALASAVAVASDSYVEFGAGYLTDEGGEARQYTGNTEEGTVPLASFGLYNTTESGLEISAEGENLGLDSRSGSVEIKRQGDYEIRFDMSSIPHLNSADAVSHFSNAGDEHLVLGDHYDTFDLETRRDRIALSGEKRLSSNWKISADLSKETKEGTELYGQNLPVPVDYETDIIKTNIHFVDKDAPYSFNLGYAFSSFQNGTNSATYEEMGTDDDDNPVVNVNNVYLAPDNYAHMLTLNGVYRLSDTARLSMTGRQSYMRQDADFDDYGSQMARDSVDASVDQSYLNLAYTDRFSSKTNIRARYTYKSRDNDTPVEVVGNHRNLPFSTESHKFDLEGGYRLSSSTRLSLAYAYEDYFRDDDYLEVEDTETHSMVGKLTYRQGLFTGGASLEYKERRGDDYLSGTSKDIREESQNSSYNRRYFLADLDESRIGVDGSYQFTDRLHVGGEISYFDQEYLGGESGLKNSTGTDLLLDATYMVSEGFNLFSYASGSQGTGDQVIYLEDNAQGNPLFGNVDATDTVFTLGFGGQWEFATMPLSITVDYSYSDAQSRYDMYDPTNVAGAENPDDLTTRIHYLSLEADYEVNDRLEVTGIYSYERSEIADFYMTDMSQVESYTYFEDPDYNNHFIGVAVRYYL